MTYGWHFRYITVLFQLFVLISNKGHTSHAKLQAVQQISSEAAAAFEFLDNFLHPAGGCKGKRYAVSSMGLGGGFASQFQMAATHWLRVAAAFNYTVPVLIRGHIKGYSSGPECAHAKNDYTCLFLPMSSCQDELLAHGSLISQQRHTKLDIDESMVPHQFAHMGLAWWWGIVQTRMFRMQPIVEDYIKSELIHMKNMNSGRGFPFGSPIAGLHVRHGDKRDDGFSDKSFEAELTAIKKSPECLLGPQNYCITNSVPEISNATSINDTSNTSTTNAGGNDATDNNDISESGKNSTKAYSSAHMVIYVASDDSNVLIAARKRGHLVDSSGSGLSQKTAGVAMANAVINKPEIGFNASLEIITDIFFLSQCSTLVGIAASQVFRTAVGISNATGILRAAIAMDYDKLPQIMQMSRKYHLPLPEVFLDSRED